MTFETILKECEKHGVKFIDLKFSDMPGTWQHFSVPIERFKKDIFTEGLGFDGSSIRGFKEINESDMVLIPDSETFFLDPFGKFPTGSFICDTFEEINRHFDGDPRHIARRAEKYLRDTGIADAAFFGPEAEFFIFDGVKFNSGENFSYHEIRSGEANWENGSHEDNISSDGYKIRNKEGYFPVAPLDKLADIRREMVLELLKIGIEAEKEHHEVAAGGQAEINFKCDTLVSVSDKMMKFKYIVKNVAAKNGKTATFMPKPLFGDNGSGMHTHISLWKNKKPLFYQKGGYADLSKGALYFIGGLLVHARALAAFTAPTTNSYKRLVPGFEAPVNLVYSKSNRSAAIRIPDYSRSPEAKRVEFRPPDPSANPYLAFSAMLMAGLDGIKNKIDPGKPLDENIYALDAKKAGNIPQMPDSLDKSLAFLEKDNRFLLAGEVFTEKFIGSWIDYKKTREYDFVRLRPAPAEFMLYFDC